MASKGYDISNYVEVADRLTEAFDRWPEGSMQGECVYCENPAGWLCTASFYRSPDDPRPGIGHAFEPVPGKTPYTRDSECMNAETSAWGRALVAVGLKTKHIASANEIRARRGEGSANSPSAPSPTSASGGSPPSPDAGAEAISFGEDAPHPEAAPFDPPGDLLTDKQNKMLGRLVTKLTASGQTDVESVRAWMDAHFGKTSRASLTKSEASEVIEWLLELEKAAA